MKRDTNQILCPVHFIFSSTLYSHPHRRERAANEKEKRETPDNYATSGLVFYAAAKMSPLKRVETHKTLF